MRSEPRQQRSRDRLDRILSATDEVLAKDGYDAFTTSAVAACAEVPASSVYRWFADKDELATATGAWAAARWKRSTGTREGWRRRCARSRSSSA